MEIKIMKKLIMAILVIMIMLTSMNSAFAYTTKCGKCNAYREGTISCEYAYTDYYCEFGNIPFCPGYNIYKNARWTCEVCDWSFIHDTHKCKTGGHDPNCYGDGFSFCPY